MGKIKLYQPGKGQGKDSLNLVELPLSSFANSVPVVDSSSEQIMTLITTDKTDPIGRKSRQGYMKVSIPVKDENGKIIGHKTSFSSGDEDLVVALLEMTYHQGFRSREVRFNSITEILEYMGLSSGGDNYKKLDRSLHALFEGNVETDLFWDNELRTYQIRKFHMLDELRIDDIDENGKRIPNKGRGGSIIWNEYLFQSFQQGYLKNLNTKIYKMLKSPATRKMYRILDKRFYKNRTVYLPVKYLGHTLLRLKEGSLSYYKRNIDRYNEELLKINYLGKVWYDKRYHDDYIFFEKPQIEIFPDINKFQPEDATTQDLLEGMMRHGISEKYARNFLMTKDNKLIGDWIDCIEREMALENGVVRGGGFLFTAIDKDYELPKMYTRYRSNNEELKERKLLQQKKQTEINACSYCDEMGNRWFITKNYKGTKISTRTICDHQQHEDEESVNSYPGF